MLNHRHRDAFEGLRPESQASAPPVSSWARASPSPHTLANSATPNTISLEIHGRDTTQQPTRQTRWVSVGAITDEEYGEVEAVWRSCSGWRRRGQHSTTELLAKKLQHIANALRILLTPYPIEQNAG